MCLYYGISRATLKHLIGLSKIVRLYVYMRVLQYRLRELLFASLFRRKACKQKVVPSWMTANTYKYKRMLPFVQWQAAVDNVCIQHYRVNSMIYWMQWKTLFYFLFMIYFKSTRRGRTSMKLTATWVWLTCQKNWEDWPSCHFDLYSLRNHQESNMHRKLYVFCIRICELINSN